MTINRRAWNGLTRAAAVGAIAVASLASAGTALASPGDATVLDHQLSQHLAPGGQAAFQFQYTGTGDLAELVVLPTSGVASQLSLRVLGPDNQAVELYDGGSTAAAIKDNVLEGPAGTYTVEVTNQDGQAASDFAISEQETPVAAGDQSSSSQPDAEAPIGE
jgi:hypothetical protein